MKSRVDYCDVFIAPMKKQKLFKILDGLRVRIYLGYILPLKLTIINIWQVHYDLGGIHFQQGCSDPSVYEKAREHFRMARELLTKVSHYYIKGTLQSK